MQKGTWKNRILPILAAAICIAVLNACTPKGAVLKEELLAALDKQSELRSFRFQGTAALSIPGMNRDEGGSRVPAALLGSTLSWKGTADLGQNRMELELSVRPEDSGVAFSFPLVLHENRLYFRLPVYGKESADWFLEFPGNERASLAESGLALADLMKLAVQPLGPEFFETPGRTGETEKRIRIPVEQDRLPELLASVGPEVPAMLDLLVSSGLVTEEQANRWSGHLESGELAERLKGLRLDEPGGITFTLNGDGFITAYEFRLNARLEGNPDERFEIQWTGRLDDLNQPQEFQREIPDEALSLNELFETFSSSGTGADSE